MATTLPSYTKTIDNAFTDTWYDIKAEATDNILLATVIWAKLKMMGCFKPQTGGETITRTIKYAVPTSQVVGVARGDTLPMGETETETMAIWKWRYMAAPIQRTTLKDQQNQGKYKIKDYVKRGMEDIRNAMTQVFETSALRVNDTTETAHKYPQSLEDVLCPYANRATGTYGGINRSNTWWQNKYKQWTAPREVNLVSDMRNLWNSIGLNQAYPNLIVTDQTTFEMYEDFGVDATQIIKNGTGGLADLGFEALKYKGADMVWTPNVTTAGDLNMYNTDFIDVMYDPTYWMEMSEWKTIPNQFERVAHILATCTIVTDQPRRHGKLYI